MFRCSPSEYFLGGWKGSNRKTTKQILEYDCVDNKWRHVGDMATNIRDHSVSVLPDIWSFCRS